jgi:hypothetical protein
LLLTMFAHAGCRLDLVALEGLVALVLRHRHRRNLSPLEVEREALVAAASVRHRHR